MPFTNIQFMCQLLTFVFLWFYPSLPFHFWEVLNAAEEELTAQTVLNVRTKCIVMPVLKKYLCLTQACLGYKLQVSRRTQSSHPTILYLVDEETFSNSRWPGDLLGCFLFHFPISFFFFFFFFTVLFFQPFRQFYFCSNCFTGCCSISDICYY